jgi:Na+/melibiose symporter-like transporter
MTETSDVLIGKSSGKKKVLFAFPRLGSSLVLGMEGFALFNLYFTGFGVSALLVTLAQAIGYIVIGFGQFFMGWISDGKYTKWGRRKPYIIAFAPLLGISYIFLFLPTLFLPNLTLSSATDLSPDSQATLFIWFLIWDILFKISYSMTTVYQSWMAEQFKNPERPKVSQYQNYFNWIGNGAMSLVSILVLTGYVNILFPPGGGTRNIYAPIPSLFLTFVLTFGIIVIVSFLLSGIFMPTEPRFEIKTSLKENLKIVLKNRNYLLVTLMIGIASLGWSILVDALLAFNQAVLFLPDVSFYIIAVVLLVGIFTFLYLWRKILERSGKKNALLNIFLFAAVFLPYTLLATIEIIPRLLIGIIFVIIATGALGGWYLFPYIIYADIAQDDEKKTGQLKAGIYTGFNSIILNLFQAFGVFVLGVAIEHLPNITLTGEAVPLGLILFGPISSVIILISYYYTKRYVKLDFEWEKKQTE